MARKALIIYTVDEAYAFPKIEEIRMSIPLAKMVIEILKGEPKRKFIANELAVRVWEIYKAELLPKRNNPRFKTDEDLVAQLQAEIGSQKEAIKKAKGIIVEEQTRPKVYFYDEDYNPQIENITTNNSDINDTSVLEKDLYPILADYLFFENGVFSKRIDEQKSKNNRGPNGNKWLHPDVVGIEILDKEWENIVSDCVKGSGGNRVKLYSFEVKRVLTPSNLRESFFQSVSNSSWANSGYLVAVEIKGDIFDELKMLSALHGIGFILLDLKNPSESQILLQCANKELVDWESVNRLLNQNSDFFDFVQSLKVYYESGVINKNDWYRIAK